MKIYTAPSGKGSVSIIKFGLSFERTGFPIYLELINFKRLYSLYITLRHKYKLVDEWGLRFFHVCLAVMKLERNSLTQALVRLVSCCSGHLFFRCFLFLASLLHWPSSLKNTSDFCSKVPESWGDTEHLLTVSRAHSLPFPCPPF